MSSKEIKITRTFNFTNIFTWNCSSFARYRNGFNYKGG